MGATDFVSLLGRARAPRLDAVRRPWTEPAKFPAGMNGDASRIFDFCAAIVDATHDLGDRVQMQIACPLPRHRAEAQLERLIGTSARPRLAFR